MDRIRHVWKAFLVFLVAALIPLVLAGCAETEGPSGEHPAVEQPSTEHPTKEQPSKEHPSKEDPSKEHPSGEHSK